jgi:hypothetical protein
VHLIQVSHVLYHSHEKSLGELMWTIPLDKDAFDVNFMTLCAQFVES